MWVGLGGYVGWLGPWCGPCEQERPRNQVVAFNGKTWLTFVTATSHVQDRAEVEGYILELK